MNQSNDYYHLYALRNKLYGDECKKSCRYELGIYQCIPTNNNKLIEKTYYTACSQLQLSDKFCQDNFNHDKILKKSNDIIDDVEETYKKNNFKPFIIDE